MTSFPLFQKLLEDLIQICHFPPPPDGVCRHHTDSADSRTDIYRSDLDFKVSCVSSPESMEVIRLGFKLWFCNFVHSWMYAV